MVEDFVRYHVECALEAVRAEFNGDKARADRIRAEGNLRLMVMSDAELHRLAWILTPVGEDTRTRYQELLRVKDYRTRTASEWIGKLRPDPTEKLYKN